MSARFIRAFNRYVNAVFQSEVAAGRIRVGHAEGRMSEFGPKVFWSRFLRRETDPELEKLRQVARFRHDQCYLYLIVVPALFVCAGAIFILIVGPIFYRW